MKSLFLQMNALRKRTSRPRTSGIRIAALLLPAVFVFLPISDAAAQSDSFVVIVHVENPTATLDSDTVARMFMKKRSSWDHDDWDESVIPIDRPIDSSLREDFSSEIHGKSVKALNSYWQRMIFSGRNAPPDTLETEEAVLDYVAANPGAIAYVEADTELPDGVKELEITDD